jgi:trimethylamine--corrinoid protein Co-methyltransferase
MGIFIVGLHRSGFLYLEQSLIQNKLSLVIGIIIVPYPVLRSGIWSNGVEYIEMSSMSSTNPLKVLDEEQIQTIRQTALDLLHSTGVMIKEPRARGYFRENGAEVDEESMRVRIPPELVEDALQQVPSSFTLHARNPENTVEVDYQRMHVEPMIGRLNILDHVTGERRRTNLNDVENLIRVADAMEYYHLIHSGAIMPSIDGVPLHASHVFGYLASLRNTGKVVKGSPRGRSTAEDCIRMAAVLAGGEEALRIRPNIFTTVNPITPFQHDQGQTEGLIEYASYGLPIDVTSEPQAGATAPITLAGLLAQQTADVFSGIVLTQLVNPGTPVWYGTCGTIMDMKVGRIALGAVEAGLINAASAQIAAYNEIPCRGTGATTDSKQLDMQAGYEKAITLFMAALGGINCLFYPGAIESALTISLESLVIDNEICGMAYRALQGIEVNSDTLATSMIELVGPGGNYLGQRHTMNFLTQEQFLPMISNRQTREDWNERAGGKSGWQRAKDEVQRILEEHEPPPLESKIEAELERIVREVEARNHNS